MNAFFSSTTNQSIASHVHAERAERTERTGSSERAKAEKKDTMKTMRDGEDEEREKRTNLLLSMGKRRQIGQKERELSAKSSVCHEREREREREHLLAVA